MPPKAKFDWLDLLDPVRHLWSELGRAPSVNAVNTAVGGGGTKRIQLAITAVGIERGVNMSLYATLPDDLRVHITDPKDGPEAVPEVDGCSPNLASAVREAQAQVARACADVERAVRADAECLVRAGADRAAADLAVMSRRLEESAADADAEARSHAAVVAEYERRLGHVSAALSSAHAELSGKHAELTGSHRERDHFREELRRARDEASETRARWEQSLERQHIESAAHAESLAAVTERALHAEAERDAVREISERLTGELDTLRRTADEAAVERDSEIEGLRAELAAAKQAHQDADRLRAVADALLAEARARRPELAAR